MKKFSLEELSKMNDEERIDFAIKMHSLSEIERKEFYSNYSAKDKLVLAEYLLDAVKDILNENEMVVYDKLREAKNKEFFGRHGQDYNANMN